MHPSRFALACAAVLLAAAAPTKPQTGTPVALQAQPGTPLDQAARQLVADDLAAATARGDRPLVLIGSARLGGDRPALFVQLQSPKECGLGRLHHVGLRLQKRRLDAGAGQRSRASHRRLQPHARHGGPDRQRRALRLDRHGLPQHAAGPRGRPAAASASPTLRALTARPARRPTSSPARRAPAPRA